VTWVVTDLAMLHRENGGFVLKEIAPGFTADEVAGLTEMSFTVAPDIRVMQQG
jgi:acyl CoA:acetate/3-ketoacid CoA transferase beta subunit